MRDTQVSAGVPEPGQELGAAGPGESKTPRATFQVPHQTWDHTPQETLPVHKEKTPTRMFSCLHGTKKKRVNTKTMVFPIKQLSVSLFVCMLVSLFVYVGVFPCVYLEELQSFSGVLQKSLHQLVEAVHRPLDLQVLFLNT